jgi:hypothetical protein
MYNLGILCGQNNNSLFFASCSIPPIRGKGFLENSPYHSGVIVCCDAIDGKSLAFHTFMDQHQLAARVTLVFIPALLHGQPDWFHWRLTGR